MRPTVRARCAALSVTVCVTRISLADPVLVLGVTLDRAPAPSALGPTASALGPDALSGTGSPACSKPASGARCPRATPSRPPEGLSPRWMRTSAAVRARRAQVRRR